MGTDCREGRSGRESSGNRMTSLFGNPFLSAFILLKMPFLSLLIRLSSSKRMRTNGRINEDRKGILKRIKGDCSREIGRFSGSSTPLRLRGVAAIRNLEIQFLSPYPFPSLFLRDSAVLIRLSSCCSTSSRLPPGLVSISDSTCMRTGPKISRSPIS